VRKDAIVLHHVEQQDKRENFFNKSAFCRKILHSKLSGHQLCKNSDDASKPAETETHDPDPSNT
jgi:hypothetical protein